MNPPRTTSTCTEPLVKPAGNRMCSCCFKTSELVPATGDTSTGTYDPALSAIAQYHFVDFLSVHLILRHLPSLRRELVSQTVPFSSELDAKIASCKKASTFRDLLLPHDGGDMKQCGLYDAGDDCIPCERHRTV